MHTVIYGSERVCIVFSIQHCSCSYNCTRIRSRSRVVFLFISCYIIHRYIHGATNLLNSETGLSLSRVRARKMREKEEDVSQTSGVQALDVHECESENLPSASCITWRPPEGETGAQDLGITWDSTDVQGCQHWGLTHRQVLPGQIGSEIAES
jgi:hypothetical protein